jgi:hypothetical protein
VKSFVGETVVVTLALAASYGLYRLVTENVYVVAPVCLVGHIEHRHEDSHIEFRPQVETTLDCSGGTVWGNGCHPVPTTVLRPYPAGPRDWNEAVCDRATHGLSVYEWLHGKR